ncbi:MAG TPA: EAL domain-containing protein [Gammaproteobacteria bacterium]|nr:EAL domain-containing protein [Gammaproteobacteria bacterium]
MSSARILIVDDNESIHQDFRKVLGRPDNEDISGLEDLEKDLFGDEHTPGRFAGEALLDYEVDSAFQGKEALAKVRAAAAEGRPYALLFMDVRMPPGWDGIETISHIWAEFPFTEMVICSAYSDYSWEEIIERLGSSDSLLFLRKPFEAIVVKQMAHSLVKKWSLGNQAREYVANLEREVSQRTEQLKTLLEELKLKNHELEHHALHDPLTGLANRVLFSDRLAHRLKTAERDNEHFGVAIMDVNRFKEINDKHGHLVGDQVLQKIAERLKDTLRSADTVARFGGDEFAILLYNLDPGSAETVCKKISHALDEPVLINGLSLHTGGSLGVAVYPEHGDSEEAMLKHADMAMYWSKAAGERYRCYSHDEEHRRSEKLQLTEELHSAILDGGLALFYQPIIDLGRGTVRGMEALARWPHPERGMVMPDVFIALAEQKGLIQELTLWVLETAVQQCRAWRDQGLELEVSVNLSTRNFLDPLFPQHLQACLARWSLPPAALTLEITESSTLTNPERALGILNTLDEMGLELSIDDYGTGFSSLAYMKRLPVDEVKIDRMFVSDIDTEPKNQVIVNSTIELAHSLGMRVVAEGIENEAVLALLGDMGCDRAQGYFISRPQDAAAITRWLDGSRWWN